MLQAERFEKIENIINNKVYCSIHELSRLLGVSGATVRRDIKALAEEKRIFITRGGATSISSRGTKQEPPYSVKEHIHSEEKTRIAKRACSLIAPGDAVLLDAGSTAMHMVPFLVNIPEITVATNDVLLAATLAKHSKVDLTVIGGGVRKNHYAAQGYFAQLTLQHMNFDKVFFGIDAVSLRKGVMISNEDEVLVKKLMLGASKTKIMIGDHSKFNAVAFVHLCGVRDVDMMITGTELDASVYEEFIQEGIPLERV